MKPEEFMKAVDVLEGEKKIPRETIFEAMELAMAAAYKKSTKGETNLEVVIDRENGEMQMFSVLEVVEEITDEDFEEGTDSGKIVLEDAKKLDKKYKIGDKIKEEIDPNKFGRVATSIAKQVVMQKIREAERESISEEYMDKEGEMVTGNVFRQDANNYYIELSRSHAILPKSELIPGEELTMGTSIKVYVTKIEKNTKGPLILLSRKHYGFVRRLLESEIPEFQDGTIGLFAVARDAGSRSKIAVYSENSKVDAVGACIGERGSRINRIIEQLNGERIDVVRYDKEPREFIKNALSPAKNAEVYITDPKESEAIVVLDDENLSLGIGKKGQNVRLASMLTHFRLDIKSKAEAREMGIASE